MTPPVVIETIRDPNAYSQAQIDEMCLVWVTLNRGLLKVVIEPGRDRADR